jgi:hypothetical protein
MALLQVYVGLSNPTTADALRWLTLPTAAAIGGLVAFRRFRFRERRLLPVPSLACWQEAREVQDQRLSTEDWEQFEARMRAQLPATIKRSRARADHWGEEAYRALEQCDYLRAWTASRLALEADPQSLPGLLAHAVAAGYFGSTERVGRFSSLASRQYGLGASVSWGVGWALVMLENWSLAENYLLEAAALRLEEPTTHSLLGLCQWHEGKLQEALGNFQQAVALAPRAPAHRIELTRLLLALGRPREALREIEALDLEAAGDFKVMLGRVRAHLALGHEVEGAQQAAALEQAHPGPKTLLCLARAYAEANQDGPARGYLEQVEDIGFCPEALVELARIELRAREHDEARVRLLSALDITREAVAGTRPAIEMLGVVCRALVELGEPVDGCAAWTAHLDMSASPVPMQRLSLLVCAPGQAAACEHVRALYRAMHPGQELPGRSVTWEPVESPNQPEGAVVPGIYRHWSE